MWFAVLALAGVAAAETQCNCAANQLYNPETRQCVNDADGLPVNWTGSSFLYDHFTYQNCDDKAQWTAHFSNGYQPVRVDDQCSCIASNRIDLDTNVDTATGYSWDYTTNTCRVGVLKNPNMATSNEIDVEECAYKLVNNYPDAFSHCGSLNMCHCAQTNRVLMDAIALSPDHNASGNAGNVDGDSYRECGWDFLTQQCVAQTAQYSGSPLFLYNQRMLANGICNDLGYFEDQSGRVKNAPETRYVQISPTIAMCAAKGPSSMNNYDKCSCLGDPRCFLDAQDQCVPNMVNNVEVNRTSVTVDGELIAEECGDTYCGTLTTACDCFETPHSTGGVCGWNKAAGNCDATTVSQLTDMFEAHCCDAFKTPCECKLGRLPWSGNADFDNTCGWDGAEGVCRLSAITTEAEMIGDGCAVAGDCILVDTEANCDLAACSWLDRRFTCVPQ